VAISGATHNTYTIVTGDVGHTILGFVTASNAGGSATQAGHLSGVVTSGAPVGVGTGASDALCSGTCTTPTFSTSGTLISTNDGAGRTVNTYIYPGIPGNLVTNDATHPVPLVIIYPDSCTAANTWSDPTKGAACFTANSPDYGPYGWSQIAASIKAMLIVIFANGSGSYWAPTLWGPVGSPGNADGHDCGTSGTAACDQVPETQAAISWAEAHYAIDTSKIFLTGGSKGGFMTNDAVCSTSGLENEIAGASANAGPISSQTTSASGIPGQFGGSCPNLVKSGATSIPNAPSPVTAKPIMFQETWSAGDAGQGCSGVATVDGHASNSDCMNGGGTTTGTGGLKSGVWAYAQDTASTVQPSIISGLITPSFGCSNTPTQAVQDTSIYVRTYKGCAGNSDNGTAVQSIDYESSGCHAYGCNNQQHGQTFIAQVMWNFWTTATTTPES
jgi:poly(3-hydroxybutyrate) depolymerase